jgi:hypothetical protein
MPKDRNDVELQVGDIVTIRAKVTHLTDHEHLQTHCNISVQLEVPMNEADKPRWLTLGSRQVAKVSDGLDTGDTPSAG